MQGASATCTLRVRATQRRLVAIVSRTPRPRCARANERTLAAIFFLLAAIVFRRHGRKSTIATYRRARKTCACARSSYVSETVNTRRDRRRRLIVTNCSSARGHRPACSRSGSGLALAAVAAAVANGDRRLALIERLDCTSARSPFATCAPMATAATAATRTRMRVAFKRRAGRRHRRCRRFCIVQIHVERATRARARIFSHIKRQAAYSSARCRHKRGPQRRRRRARAAATAAACDSRCGSLT